jgi:Skp family chaperone for outer membrane proteins
VKRLIACAWALAAMTGCATQSSSAVATVDLQRIQANWPKFINYSNQLQADTEAITRSNETPSQKQQDLGKLRQRFVDMQNEVTGDVRSAAQQVADEKHFKLVVTRQFVGYGGTDITPDVERILKITEASPSGS